MFDITTTRRMAVQSHPPPVVFGLLFVFAPCAELLAGSAMARSQSRHWLHSATFAFALAGSVYVIIDMEFSRVGLIRVDAFDEVLVELRRNIEWTRVRFVRVLIRQTVVSAPFASSPETGTQELPLIARRSERTYEEGRPNWRPSALWFRAFCRAGNESEPVENFV
jgi:hypothetical protein